MTHIEELWSELNDLPGALLALANGRSFDDFTKLFYDPSFDRNDYAGEKSRARKYLQMLAGGQIDEVGRAAVKKLLKAKDSFETRFDWNNGLTLRASGVLETSTLHAGVTYAIARTADLCARKPKNIIKCDACGNFAIRDKRGSGNRRSQQWCSPRCKDRAAQRRKRERDRKRA